MSSQIPLDRYQYKPYVGSSHSWALSQLLPLKSDTKLLDIGSGSGAFGRELAERGWSNLYSVEIDDPTRDETSKWYNHSAKTLKAFEGEKFEVILLLDIIEHLARPVDFLSDLRAYCNPTTSILISVPNIAHWAVRLLMLAGRFEYMERGPLDATHLHFFTKRHLKKSIESVPGYSIEEWNVSIVPLELLVPEWLSKVSFFNFVSQARLRTARIIPELAAYQLLVRARFSA
jgi:cyclopropane fatty-acyl-phospholipid synthase-like methyltransferase